MQPSLVHLIPMVIFSCIIFPRHAWASLYSYALHYLTHLILSTRAVKRKGFGQQVEGSGRHDGGVTCAPNCPTTSAGSGGGPSSSSGPGTAGTAEPHRTGSETRREPSDRQCSASVSQVSNMSTHSGIHHSTSSANGSIKDMPHNQVTGLSYLCPYAPQSLPLPVFTYVLLWFLCTLNFLKFQLESNISTLAHDSLELDL